MRQSVVAHLAADVHGEDRLALRRQPRHRARGLGQPEERVSPVGDPVDHVRQQSPAPELHVDDRHRPIAEAARDARRVRALDELGQDVHRRGAHHRIRLLVLAAHPHAAGPAAVDQDGLDRALEPHAPVEALGEVLAQQSETARRVDVPDVRALRLLARVAVGDRTARQPARHAKAEDVRGAAVDLRRDHRWGELAGRRAGPGLDQRNRHLLGERVAVLAAVPVGRARRPGCRRRAGDSRARTAPSRNRASGSGRTGSCRPGRRA